MSNQKYDMGENLVQSWLVEMMHKRGITMADALREMNKTLNSAHTHSRVREWEENRNGRGSRLPREIRIFMGQKSIRSILESAGIDTTKISSRALNKIVEQLS